MRIVSNSCLHFSTKGRASRPFFIFFFLFISFISQQLYSDSPGSFARAKTIAKKVFADKRETLYCSCRFNEENQVDLKSCHMEEASSIERARRIEWEHIMPAEHFGRHFQCWKEAICEKDGKVYRGRKCCEKVDKNFREIESELYNLWPSVGVVNQKRSNYDYSTILVKTDLYGCDFSVNKQEKKVEPKNAIKGLVARANLFMAYRYNIPLSAEQRLLFETWHAQYPPTELEIIWGRQVAAIEGYNNPYIETNPSILWP